MPEQFDLPVGCYELEWGHTRNSGFQYFSVATYETEAGEQQKFINEYVATASGRATQARIMYDPTKIHLVYAKYKYRRGIFEFSHMEDNSIPAARVWSKFTNMDDEPTGSCDDDHCEFSFSRTVGTTQ